MGNEVVVGGLGRVLHFLGNLFDGVGGAHRVVVMIDDSLLVDDIDLALEVVLAAERDEDWPGIGAEFLAHGVDGIVEIRAGAIHFINERDAGNSVFGGLAPDGLGLGLDASDAAEHGDCAIENAQGALDLGREVHMAWSVDDVHPHFDSIVGFVDAFLRALHPRASGGGGGDRNAALALLLHPVGDSRALVHLTDLVDHAGVKKDSLGESGFAGIDVRGDADVACALERESAVGGVRVRGVGRGCHGVFF